MDLTLVEGDLNTVTGQLVAAGSPAFPVAPVSFTLAGVSTTASLSPLGRFSVTLTADMVDEPGVFLAYFTDADGSVWPSRNLLEVAVLPHTRGHS